MDAIASMPGTTLPSDSMSYSSRESDTIDPRKQKRFTLTLPIQTSYSDASLLSLTSPTRSSTAGRQASDNGIEPATPSDVDFLTAVAAQERRVLELREELFKAEQVLQKLKKDWAVQEVHKMRQDIRRMRSARQPRSAGSRSPVDTEHSQAIAEETERRRAMHFQMKTSQRKVFSGSKHARALSLLSPNSDTGTFPSMQPRSVAEPSPTSDPLRPIEPEAIGHRRTLSGEMQRSKSYDASSDLDNMPRDVLLRAGRQMATDFKDGLWTFLEDLRQVTVGEEEQAVERPRLQRIEGMTATKDRRKVVSTGPRRAPRPRRPEHAAPSADPADVVASEPSPKDSAVDFDRDSKDISDLIDIAISGSPTPRKVIEKRRRSSVHGHSKSFSRASDVDAWDNWDSPKAKDEKPQACVADDNLFEESKSTDIRALLDDALDTEIKREPIPWPTLVKLAPSNLRRTASHLMTEWERSITPVPEDGKTVRLENRKLD